MDTVPIVKAIVGEALRANIAYLFGDRKQFRQADRPLSPFEQDVARELSKKASDGSLALINVPVAYHPISCDLQSHDGKSEPQPPFVKAQWLVRVEGRVPHITSLDPKPDEVCARGVLEETLRLYHARTRQLPYR